MITVLKSYAAEPVVINGTTMSRAVIRFAGLSGDEKPVDVYQQTVIANGSTFLEIDTGSNYAYDEENDEWQQQSAGGSGGGSGTGVTAAEIIQLITLAMGNTPITRVVVEDAAETVLNIETWDMHYFIPGTSLQSLEITLPATTPTSISSCIKVVIGGIHRFADPDDPTTLLAPSIVLPPEITAYNIIPLPTKEGDRWMLTIDNDLTATGMVIPKTETGESEG